MKKVIVSVLILFTFLFPLSAHAEKAPPHPILYTYYRQVGWGDRVEIGFVDSDGDLWKLTGHDGNLQWPYSTEDQLRYLEKPEEKGFEKIEPPVRYDLFDLKSLVYAVKESKEPIQPAANDAGTECAYAVRYSRDGIAEPVLLGISGDSMFENTDFNAQGLYSAIHTLFPDITCYAGDEQIGPKGFIPVSITEFCNLGDLTGAAVTAYFNDCEGGPFEIEMSREEQAAFVDDVLHSVVTGKVSAAGTTGGFRDYFFSKGDQTLGRIAIYDGLLYCSDGMYSFEREAP